jgi:diguanylate cyclase (GGDEF)-like protein
VPERDAETPLALGALDELTGLRNQRALWRELGRRLSVCSPESPLAVVMIDFDMFSAINHVHGREVGDEILQRAGKVIRDGGTSPRLAFRTGGEEFAVLVPGDEEAGRERAEDLRSRIEQQRGELPVTVSCGVAGLSEPVEPWVAVDRADAALYEAKQTGGNTVVVAGQTESTAEQYLLDARAPEASRRAALALAVASAAATSAKIVDDPEDMLTLCEAIGRRLGLGGADLDRLLAGAQLHDVGKVAVPPELFNKPGPLTPDEQAIIDEHTVIGEGILRSVPDMAEIATIVRHSSEHWDGSGRPDGLAGERIPLPSRIILCSSAFRAMRTDRPYRPARSALESIEELTLCAGTQFDPAVVKALVDVADGVRRQQADPQIVFALPRSRRLVALLAALSISTGTAFAAIPEARELARSIFGTSTGPSDILPDYTGPGVGRLSGYIAFESVQVPAEKPAKKKPAKKAKKPKRKAPVVAAPVEAPPAAAAPPTYAAPPSSPSPAPPQPKPQPAKPKPKPPAQDNPTSGWGYLPPEPQPEPPPASTPESGGSSTTPDGGGATP